MSSHRVVPRARSMTALNSSTRASISLEAAIAAAQAAASGKVGEVDLEFYQGRLVFNVDIGDQDVKVDAENGTVLGQESEDANDDQDDDD